MTASLAVIDRLSELHEDLEKVRGTLAMTLNVGNPDSEMEISPKEFLNMLQLLADIVSPVCEELEAIMHELDTQPASPTLPQGRKARLKQKGR
jgi:hypothetical protein